MGSCIFFINQYGLKKKVLNEEDPGLEGRLGRKKKTAEELAAEATVESDEDTPGMYVYTLGYTYNLQLMQSYNLQMADLW